MLIAKDHVDCLPRKHFLSLRLSRAHNHVSRQRFKRSEQRSADLNIGTDNQSANMPL
jgi:hypothetical protein